MSLGERSSISARALPWNKIIVFAQKKLIITATERESLARTEKLDKCI